MSHFWEDLGAVLEIISYKDNQPEETNLIKYETDLIICQNLSENEWKPRIIIEGKLNSVTTHDAITYSQKAATHKNVHPFLRYGILIGNRKHFPLPGRLFIKDIGVRSSHLT